MLIIMIILIWIQSVYTLTDHEHHGCRGRKAHLPFSFQSYIESDSYHAESHPRHHLLDDLSVWASLSEATTNYSVSHNFCYQIKDGRLGFNIFCRWFELHQTDLTSRNFLLVLNNDHRSLLCSSTWHQTKLCKDFPSCQANQMLKTFCQSCCPDAVVTTFEEEDSQSSQTDALFVILVSVNIRREVIYPSQGCLIKI